MGTYNDYRALINQNIKANGAKEITGTIDNNVRQSGVDLMEEKDVKSFSQETAPTGTVIGDFWYKPSTNELHRWTGSAWELYDLSGNVPFTPIPPQDYVDLVPQATPPNYQEARFYYDSNKKSFVVYNDVDGSEIVVGRNLLIRVYNDTGLTILKGKIVGPIGSFQGFPTVGLSNASIKSTTQLVGVVSEDILDGTFGYVIKFGEQEDFNTALFNEGDILYLSNVDGEVTNIRPVAPNYATRIGAVSKIGTLDGVIVVDIVQFAGTDTDVNIEGAINGIVTQTPDVAISVSGGIIYADVTNENYPTKNLPFLIDGKKYELNTTTNTGIGGAARVIVPPGLSDVDKQLSFIFIWIDSGVPMLGIATTEPPIAFAKIGELIVFDAAHTLAHGQPFGYRRSNNAINLLNGVNDGGIGIIEDILSAIRNKLGSNWNIGQDSTPLVDNTQIRVELTAGIARQFRQSNLPAFDGLNYLIFNDNTNTPTYFHSSNLTDITETALGDSLLSNNRYYTIRLFYMLNSNGIGNHVLATRPLGYYTTSEEAIFDPNNFTVNVNDTDIEEIVYPLYDIIIGRTGTGGSTISLIQLTDLRTKLPTSLGGGGASGGGGTDDKVRVSAADTTNDYLNSKIITTGGISKRIASPGANESIELNVSPWIDLTEVYNETISVREIGLFTVVDLVPGMGLKYKLVGDVNYYYGLIQEINGLVLTIAGVILSTDVDELYYTSQSNITVTTYPLSPSSFAQADTEIESKYDNIPIEMQTGKLIYFKTWSKTADTSATPSQIQITNNGQPWYLGNVDGLRFEPQFFLDSGVNANPLAYEYTFGDVLRLDITQPGGNLDTTQGVIHIYQITV